MTKVGLSLIIPTYNEVDIIENSLSEIVNALGPDHIGGTELFIVDDGTDALNEKIPDLKKRFPFLSIKFNRNSPPLGKGASIAWAMEEAQGDVVGFVDVDLSTPPQYILKALENINSGLSEIYIGSRKISGSTVNRKQFFFKDLLGHGFNFFTHRAIFIGMRHFKDTQCGFKFFKNKNAKILYKNLVAHDGLTDLEILLRANFLKMKVVECPVEWEDLRESKRTLKRIFVGEIASFFKIFIKYKILPWRG